MSSNTTTIQVSKFTLEKLKQLKDEYHSANYDEIIAYLIKKEHDVPDSLFGFMKRETTPYAHDIQDSDHDHA
jgi:predicted CopG family antitoxin